MKNIKFRRTKHADLLIIGHPRCGSGFAAQICQEVGLDIGHEKFGKNGISSWMFAVDSNSMPFGNGYGSSSEHIKFKHIVHHVRNPFTAMDSIIIENRVHASFVYRDKHIKELLNISINTYPRELERAIVSFLAWNYLATLKKPDITFRIEDESNLFVQYLKEKKLIEQKEYNLSNKPANTSEHHFNIGKKELSSDDLTKTDLKIFIKPVLTPNHWKQCDKELINLLIDFCKCYGYKIPEYI